MKTTRIRDWRDVMHVACPPDRTPTPTIPGSAEVMVGSLDRGPTRVGMTR